MIIWIIFKRNITNFMDFLRSQASSLTSLHVMNKDLEEAGYVFLPFILYDLPNLKKLSLYVSEEINVVVEVFDRENTSITDYNFIKVMSPCSMNEGEMKIMKCMVNLEFMRYFNCTAIDKLLKDLDELKNNKSYELIHLSRFKSNCEEYLKIE